MIKAPKIIELLDRNKARLEKLGGEEIAGFLIIYPPEGDPIEIMLQGSAPSSRAFYEYMIGRISEASKAAESVNAPYIGMTGRR